jgi:hypothetical protein
LPQAPVTPQELKRRITEQMKENEMSLEDEDGGKVRAVWREGREWLTGIADLETLGRHVGVLGPSEHLAGRGQATAFST